MSQDNVIFKKEGYLSKMRSTKWPHIWQKRYMRIEGDQLSWSKDPDSECLGFLSLSHIKWVSGAMTNSYELNFIAFQSNKSRKRIFELRAENIKDCQSWREAFNNIVEQ
mmetsp:Transcript_40013/g.55611  ORF Transcript_40013/g.55611 Transcript_40013/m.55611 type:complete len:109 (-) Transcript_40013:156-482(-)